MLHLLISIEYRSRMHCSVWWALLIKTCGLLSSHSCVVLLSHGRFWTKERKIPPAAGKKPHITFILMDVRQAALIRP